MTTIEDNAFARLLIPDVLFRLGEGEKSLTLKT